MKRICILLLLVFILLSCSRDWNSPLENDTDLIHQPQILGITQDAAGFKLQLDYSYSTAAVLLFERRIALAAYEPITMQKISSSVFADTTLDLEFDHNLTYRLRVQKGEYYTDYSNAENYIYSSTILNTPSGFTAATIELQGVRLNWQDNSGKETGYKIERNQNGAGFTEIASLPANAETYLDNISGMPASPLSLVYRVKAYTTNLNSAWQEQNVIYSGLGAPTNLTITDHSFYHFTIAWTRNSMIATGYEIERKKDSGTYSLLASVGATVQTYNTELLDNGSYTFRVRAVRNSDYSTYTNEVSQQINIIIPTEGLVAYYPFNGNANDESGNGHLNNGTNNSCISVADRFSIPSSAMSFDGQSSYITVNHSVDFNFDIADSYTLALWINPYTQLALAGLIEKWNGGMGNPYPFSVRINNASIYYGIYQIGGDYDGEDYLQAPLSSPYNDWIFVVCKKNGSASIETFINGDFVVGDYSLVNASISNTANMRFGKYDNHYFDGSIDDVRIYNRALTELEIQALYHEGGWAGK